MARLPTPGGDENSWGDVLNEYLSTAHNADGSIKASAISNKAEAADLTAHTGSLTAHGYSEGLLAARPSATGQGFYFATDQNGGTLYRSVSGSWLAVASSVQSTGMRHLGSALAPSGSGSITGAGTNAATGVAVPNGGMSVTVTTTGLPVQVRAQLWAQRASANDLDFGALIPLLDGALISSGQYNSVITLQNLAEPFRATIEIPTLSVSAGSHTFELRVYQSVTSGTVNTYGGTNLPGFLSVYEVVS